MKPLLLAATILAAGLVQAPAAAATLKPMTTLTSGQVRLSDLFDDAGPGAARVLGPAPAPGSRIVVGARQLAAIARQFGVDWRPASPGDQAVLDRPGRVLDREVLLGALRTALAAEGVSTDADLELPGFSAPLMPEEAAPSVVVEQLDLRGGGQFTAQVLVDAAGMAALRLRIAGRLREMVTLAVPTHRLAPGTPLRASDLRLARVPATSATGDALRDAREAVGMVLRRDAPAGQPLRRADLERPEAVSRGARVAVQLLAPGLLLSAHGEALQGGPVGARIPVLNTASRAVIEAEITGPGQVRVAAGSAPLTPPGGSGHAGGGYYSSFAARGAGQ